MAGHGGVTSAHARIHAFSDIYHAEKNKWRRILNISVGRAKFSHKLQNESVFRLTF